MTTNLIFIIVITSLALICAGLLIVIKRYRFKDSDYKKKFKEFDDTDLIYWKDELRNY